MKTLRVAAAVLPHPEKDGVILIGQRRSSDTSPLKWEFPGGKLREGESFQAAVVREIKEELGWDIEILKRLRQIDYEYSEDLLIRLEFFLCQIRSFKEPEKKAHETLAWVNIGTLPSYDFLEANIPFVRELADGTVLLKDSS